MDETRSSIYVAPLHIVKSTSDVAEHQTTKKRTNVAPDHDSLPCSQAQMTPPPTPDGSLVHVTGQAGSPESTSRTYLRAFYPFHPNHSPSASSSTVTLSLSLGALVLVHSIHPNGWADGTLLETGARGWLPTNYCEVYDQISMRPLLNALTGFWDVIGSCDGAILGIASKPDCTRGLVAGVRFLLEQSECLTRDSPIVKQYENVRLSRKAMLANLSSLVKMVKHIKDQTAIDEPVGAAFDNMLFKSFKIIASGVRFVDIWSEDMALDRAIESVSSILHSTSLTTQNQADCFTPPLDHDEKRPCNLDSTFPENEECQPSSPSREDQLSQMRYPSRRSLISGGSWSPSTTAVNGSGIGARPPSTHSKRTSVSRHIPNAGQGCDSQYVTMAAEKLHSSYDAFLSVLGTFLGLHMQSRSTWELLLTTQHAVTACRRLLSVIELVWEHDGRQSNVLLNAKGSLYDRITSLAHGAREISQHVSVADEDIIFHSEEIKLLIDAATACVRGAGECVAITGQLLDQMGDFELCISESSIWGELLDPAQSLNWSMEEENLLRNRAADLIGFDHPPQRSPLRPVAPHLQIPKSSTSHQKIISSNSTSPSTDSNTIVYTPSASSAAADPTDEIPGRTSFFTPVEPLISPIIFDAGSLVLETLTMPETLLRHQVSLARNVINSTGSNSTFISSPRDSKISLVSSGSTRATSPELEAEYFEPGKISFSFSGRNVAPIADFVFTDATLQRTFIRELMWNKDGQIIGGSLPALIEVLTAHHSTPDAVFVSTFYLTFRLFASPQQFAEALAFRFEYIGEDSSVAGPVRLRVYNVFKGWLESHWRHDCDNTALPFIMQFVRTTLTPALPTTGKRLLELAEKVTTSHGPLVPRLLSSIGKTNTSIAQYINPDSPLPSPIISKSQLSALRAWRMGGASVSILDFEPIELARQITLKASSIFCSILPEELLATEWMKRSGSLAVNVRAMSTLSTDLANLVADTILQLEEPKKRATIIKHWVKIANRCFELHNYDSLMAIICSLNSSTIARLKKTWDLVSQKTQALLEHLKQVVEVSRNYAALRQRLQTHVPPCLPFVGIYLTDLTFVDHGNPAARQLVTADGSIDVINYDKHVKTARIISELQRFQIPYRFEEIPELQTWMQDQLVQVRSSGEKNFQSYYRRSLQLEPREQQPLRKESAWGASGQSSKSGDKDRFDFLAWTHTNKDKSVATN